MGSRRPGRRRSSASVERARAAEGEGGGLHGRPPRASRLAMLLCDVGSIREVILFPVLRPEGGRVDGAGEGE